MWSFVTRVLSPVLVTVMKEVVRKDLLVFPTSADTSVNVYNKKNQKHNHLGVQTNIFIYHTYIPVCFFTACPRFCVQCLNGTHCITCREGFYIQAEDSSCLREYLFIEDVRVVYCTPQTRMLTHVKKTIYQ